MKRKIPLEIYVYLFLILFSLVWLREASNITMRTIGEMYIEPGDFPRYLSIAMIILCLWEIVAWFVKKPGGEPEEKSGLDAMLEQQEEEEEEEEEEIVLTEEEEKKIRRSGYIRIALLLALCVLYVLLYKTFGYLICTFVMVSGALVIFGVRSPWKIALTAAVTSGVIYSAFTYLLHVNLP